MRRRISGLRSAAMLSHLPGIELAPRTLLTNWRPLRGFADCMCRHHVPSPTARIRTMVGHCRGPASSSPSLVKEGTPHDGIKLRTSYHKRMVRREGDHGCMTLKPTFSGRTFMSVGPLVIHWVTATSPLYEKAVTIEGIHKYRDVS